MKHVRHLQHEAPSPAAKSRFDGYLIAAKLGLPIGLLPAGGYWLAFSAFGTSKLPWKAALAIALLSPATIYTHHYLNRHRRSLIFAGLAMSLGTLPMWSMLGSYWLFYFGFAPIPAAIRAASLTLSLAIVCSWAFLSWRAFSREATRPDVISRIYRQEGNRFVFSHESDLITAVMKAPGSSIVIPAGLLSALGPLVLAYTIVSGHTSDTNGGPHGVFIILSILSVPMTCWLLTSFFVRFAYFYIYFPLKLERSTGKKVVLEA